MEIFTYKKLYRAYLECRKTKRKTVNALKFEINLENNLQSLLEELKNGTYLPGRSICFVVTEPCPREIFAADFRDRVVHHLFIREIEKLAERKFIFDSYACRKEKGTHKAVSRLRDFSRKITVNYKKPAWYMKIDMRSFFMSIDQNILYSLVLELIDKHKKSNDWKIDISDLAEKIIFYNPTDNYVRKGDIKLSELIPSHKSLIKQKYEKGLPIGNYSSQFFANLYLNKLDYFAKRELKCRYYLRYVDDAVMLSDSNQILKIYRNRIDRFLKNVLNLQLNDKKTIIQPIERGIDFSGYFLKQNKIYVRRKVFNRHKNKLYRLAVGLSEMSWLKTRAMVASYAGHEGYF